MRVKDADRIVVVTASERDTERQLGRRVCEALGGEREKRCRAGDRDEPPPPSRRRDDDRHTDLPVATRLRSGRQKRRPTGASASAGRTPWQVQREPLRRRRTDGSTSGL